MEKRTGGCLCGAVRYSYDAAPLATVACHCRDCQKLTGATNLLTIYAERAAFRHEQGELARYRKRADSGREADYVRCARCGAAPLRLSSMAVHIGQGTSMFGPYMKL